MKGLLFQVSVELTKISCSLMEKKKLFSWYLSVERIKKKREHLSERCYDNGKTGVGEIALGVFVLSVLLNTSSQNNYQVKGSPCGSFSTRVEASMPRVWLCWMQMWVFPGIWALLSPCCSSLLGQGLMSGHTILREFSGSMQKIWELCFTSPQRDDLVGMSLNKTLEYFK